MRNCFFFILLLILAVIEIAILNNFKIFRAMPNLLLISAIAASLFYNFKWAISFSIFSGILKDVSSVNAFGLNTLLFTLWSFLTKELSKKISLDNNLIRLVLIFIVSLANDIAARIINLFLNSYILPLGVFLRIAILGALYTAAISPLIFRTTGCFIKYLSSKFWLRK